MPWPKEKTPAATEGKADIMLRTRASTALVVIGAVVGLLGLLLLFILAHTTGPDTLEIVGVVVGGGLLVVGFFVVMGIARIWSEQTGKSSRKPKRTG